MGFPEVTLLESLAQALDISLLELMQSQKIDADTIPKEAANASVAGALQMAQQEQRDIRLTPLWWVFYVPVCAMMVFFMVVLNWFVDTVWVRSVGVYLVILCGSLGMDAVGALLEFRRDPTRPIFSRGWLHYGMTALFWVGGLLLVIGFTLPGISPWLIAAGWGLFLAYPIFALCRHVRSMPGDQA